MCIAKELHYAVLWRDGTVEPVESGPIARQRAARTDGAALYRDRPGDEWRTVQGQFTVPDMLAQWARPAAAGE